MRRPQLCRAALVLTLGLLAAPAMLHADPFLERPIPLPWTDSNDVAVADFNNDGLPDIAALNSYGPAFTECYPPPGPISCGNRMLLTVALNEALGHFDPVVTTPAMCAPWTIVAGDFNADGRQDVMIGNRGARDAFGICSPASISYYPGDGHGGFFTPQHVVVPDEPVDMAAGDFTGDGLPELAVALGGPGKVQLFAVGPNGVFTSGAQWYAPGALAAIATGDLDDDGDDEIVAGLATGEVSILNLGVGGALVVDETCTLAATGPGPSSLVVGDFTLDLVPDIAFGRRGPQWSLVVLFRRGATGSYCQAGNALTTIIDGTYCDHLAAADLNADGIPDLATTDGVWHVRSLIGDGAGHFAASAPIATSGATADIVSADLNGDWVDDLVVSGRQVFLPTGAVLALLNETPIADVMGLVVNGDEIDWNGVYDAQAYDIVRGDLSVLRASGGDFTLATEACVANDWVWTTATLAAAPPAGKAWFIIGRPDFAGGPGTYDEWGSSQVGSRDAGINASASACP